MMLKWGRRTLFFMKGEITKEDFIYLLPAEIKVSSKIETPLVLIRLQYNEWMQNVNLLRRGRATNSTVTCAKGAFRPCSKNCSNLGCMQEIARKNRKTFYTKHPTPSNNFLNSVSVIVFQFVMVYLKSDTAYPLKFTITICKIFFFSERRFNK